MILVIVRNMEIHRSNGSKKLNLIRSLILFCIFTTVTSCRQQHIQHEFWPLPLDDQELEMNEVCETPECQETAEILKQSLNSSVDPCDDFYEFACGNWIRQNPIPPTEVEKSQFGIITDRVQNAVKGIIESPFDPKDPYPVTAAKKFYTSCLDTDRMEEEGMDQLIEMVDSFGGWPLATDNWNGESFNWQKIIAKQVKEMGAMSLITLYVYKDQKNSSRNILINDQSGLSFPRTILLDSKTYKHILDGYRKYVTGLATEIMKARNLIPASRIEAEVDELIEFEIKLAQITVPDEQRLDPYRMYNKKTLQELQRLTDSVEVTHDYAKIDWMLIFDIIFSDLDITFTPDELIIVKEVDFIPELVKLIDSTPIRVIANYLNLKIVKGMVDFTTQTMRDLQFEFSSTLSGVTEPSPRWESCISATTEALGMAVGYAYVNKYFDDETKKAAHNMVSSIRNQFSSSIDDVEWMDADTKKVAKEKADEMEEIIGYPDWFSNSSALDEYYRGISVGESYLTNMISVTKVLTNQFLGKLRKPTDRKDWLITPEKVNAFYNPQSNNILLPAGILQSPLFAAGRPVALNYGAMGAVIGHEITHGFDDSGRTSDKYGNLAQWWSQETIDTYVEKTKCFIEQYGNFRMPELDDTMHTEAKMSGVRTLGENIADNGGLRQAFIAYKKYIKKHGSDNRLPGLEEYSPEKLFFISFGVTWCGTSTLQEKLQTVLTDDHSPGKFRVLGTLSNLEQFAEIWQCPAGSPMNPAKKCKIW